jgi:flagellar M-ring protein FliF
LASEGLPTSMPDANAVLTELPMGASRSVEGARLRQAQELELARSINEISAVAQARVHLALPEKSAFLRDTQPPRASVFLQLAQGRMLEPSQVEAIVNLVSTSVPGMARGDVAVVDQMGRLLSRGSDDPAAVVSDRQLQHRLEVEKLYRERIEAMLTPIAGPGNLSVQVTVDMDFTQSQITEERVDPTGTALRSEQSELVESASRRRGAFRARWRTRRPIRPIWCPPERRPRRCPLAGADHQSAERFDEELRGQPDGGNHAARDRADHCGSARRS